MRLMFLETFCRLLGDFGTGAPGHWGVATVAHLRHKLSMQLSHGRRDSLFLFEVGFGEDDLWGSQKQNDLFERHVNASKNGPHKN